VRCPARPLPTTLTEIFGLPRTTVTVEVALPTFPFASRNRNVTVVALPIANSVVAVTSLEPICAASRVGAGSTRSNADPALRNAESVGH